MVYDMFFVDMVEVDIICILVFLKGGFGRDMK